MRDPNPTLSGLVLPPIHGCAGLASSLAPSDRRLGIMADRLDALQAHADKHAAAAGWDPEDPYTVAIAEMDLVAAGMAGLPADTMGGVLLKVRAMAVPIVATNDEAHDLAMSVCRDLRRLAHV